MKAPAVITLDFETEAIQGRPHHPPVPVGFSIKGPEDRSPEYFAWAHPLENNCTKQRATEVLQQALASGLPLLGHNMKFDMEVAQQHMGIGYVHWERIYDTLYLLFLHNPHALSFGLKPAAAELLGMAPEERDRVRTWLVEQKLVKKNDRNWGAHIAKAPGKLVGDYAKGDVIRTERLFKLLYPKIVKAGMLKAYDRERELMPILLANEQQGIRVDLDTLRADVGAYNGCLQHADNWLRKRLGVPDLNLDADVDVARALEAMDLVTEWTYTPTGRKSTSKKNLMPHMFKDKCVAAVLGYRNRLQTCLSTFMEPWLRMAEQTGGIIHTQWNQVRQGRGVDGFTGTRTGRLSSSYPNFQNIPRQFEGRQDGYTHPDFLGSLRPLPLIRRYVLPDEGGIFLHRDASQQELRILAHFEDDALCAAYNADPDLDIHNYVQNAIEEVTGKALDRNAVKILNFGMIYGMGLAKLATSMDISVEEARQIRQAHRRGVSGVVDLERQIKELGKQGVPIRTWGGRLYHVEPAKVINGEERSFEYKQLNHLIQGSAADHTKQAIINYHKIKDKGRFLVTVHDEINISAPKGSWKKEMELLKEAMENVAFDVPMASGGKIGPNWSELQEV